MFVPVETDEVEIADAVVAVAAFPVIETPKVVLQETGFPPEK